jgi:glutamyl-tRNA synthetase
MTEIARRVERRARRRELLEASGAAPFYSAVPSSALSTVPSSSQSTPDTYRGRLAPSPTGYLHLGHARTFWTAYERARVAGGALVLRNEDLDPHRARAEFAAAMVEDLRWLGLAWQEGPDVGGACAPYAQSGRRGFYLEAWSRLVAGGYVYACSCSRRDITRAAEAPHEQTHAPQRPNSPERRPALEDEPLYPGTCRPRAGAPPSRVESPAGVNWRFRVPEGEAVVFDDVRQGRQVFVAGRDFGDFVVWRRDDVPAYQLAVADDDARMRITEVVRGADLLKSTARQILLQRALGYPTPAYHHCDLVTDERGERLAKRHESLSLRRLRAAGVTPAQLLARFAAT